MSPTPEEQARAQIGRLLTAAGWRVQDAQAANIREAKKESVTLSGVETKSDRYLKGLPDRLPAWRKPLPFAYQSTGVEARFTNGLDPHPRSHNVFACRLDGGQGLRLVTWRSLSSANRHS